MASSEVERAKRTIEREATKRSIDLDAVRVADDVDADGTVIRVLETDAPNEADQVGFQIAIPPGPNGYDMFETNLRKYWPALKEHLEGDDAESDESDSELQSTDTVDESPDNREQDTEALHSSTTENSVASGSSVPQHTMNLSVGLDDGSLEDLRSEFDDFLQAIDEETVEEERVDDLEDRVDNLDGRLGDIEERLSLLGGE